MIQRTFSAEVQDGKIQLYDPEGFEAYIDALNGKRVQITVSVHSPQRSKSQNAYFHGVVCKYIGERLRQYGYEADEVKEILKHKFLLVEKEDGQVFCRPTSSLNTAEFAEFIDRCIRWAAIELNVVIPPA
jgi:hypothetical protein